MVRRKGIHNSGRTVPTSHDVQTTGAGTVNAVVKKDATHRKQGESAGHSGRALVPFNAVGDRDIPLLEQSSEIRGDHTFVPPSSVLERSTLLMLGLLSPGAEVAAELIVTSVGSSSSVPDCPFAAVRFAVP